MPDEETAEAEPLVFTLPVEGQLRDAEQLLDQLMDAEENAPIVFEADGVEIMNSAIAVVIASAAKSRAEDAPKIVVSRPTEVFTEAFKDLGLFKHLMSMEFRT